MNTNPISPRAGAVAGIIGSIAFASLWMAAAYLDGNWVLGKMTLSELGGSGRPGALHGSGGLLTAVMLLVSLTGVATLEVPAAEALAVGCLLLWTVLIGIRVLWHHPGARS